MDLMRSYPVPQPLVASAGAPSMRIGSVRRIAHSESATPELRDWAWRVIDSERDRVRSALTACGCNTEVDRHFGILDPESEEPLVIAVVAMPPSTGMLRRYNGSGWDEVPAELEPEGYGYVELDDDDLLADALGAIGAGGSLLLRPTLPKTRTRGVLAAADSSNEGFFAVVDDFDQTAVLDLLHTEGGALHVRRNGAWVSDPEMFARLRSVDPPRVVEVPVDQVDRVVAAVDEHDRGITAAAQTQPRNPEFEKLHPREGGKFAKKDKPVNYEQRAKEFSRYIAEGGARPAGVKAKDDGKKKGRASRGRGSAASDRPKRETEVSKLRDKWDAEDTQAADADAKYDIARAKADLAETKRRDAEDGKAKAEYERLNEVYANDPVKLNNAIAKLNERVRAEEAKRETYDRSTKYEAAAEKIRRAERRRATKARRLLERRRARRLDRAADAKERRDRIAARRKQGVRAAANPPERSRMDRDLKSYWVRGKGAAKIRWGVKGDFNRCRRQLSKYMPPSMVPGACANLHKAALGVWPGKKSHKAIRAAGYDGNGSMISIPIDATVASKLAVDGGVDPADMHITLAYLGDDVDPEVLVVARNIAEAIALEYNGLEATLSGTGEFVGNDEGSVQYASVDAPGLETMRVDLHDRLARAGVPLPSEHGFTPHVTLTYDNELPRELPLPIELRLGRIEVCTGPDRQGWDLLP